MFIEGQRKNFLSPNNSCNSEIIESHTIYYLRQQSCYPRSLFDKKAPNLLSE